MNDDLYRIVGIALETRTDKVTVTLRKKGKKAVTVTAEHGARQWLIGEYATDAQVEVWTTAA